jgi:hypothetical protein
MLYQNLAINNPLRNSARSEGNALARRGRSDPIGEVGGCLVIIGVVMVISWTWAILDDKARKPESEPKRTVLEEATIYVTGDDGGTFNLTWAVWPPERVKGEKEKVTGVSKPDPIPYHLNHDALDASYSVSGWYQKAPGSCPGAPAILSIRLR